MQIIKPFSVYNHQEIKDRWGLLEKKLLQFYKHPTRIQQIKQRKQIVYNKEQLTTILLKQDWFIKLFFF